MKLTFHRLHSASQSSQHVKLAWGVVWPALSVVLLVLAAVTPHHSGRTVAFSTAALFPVLAVTCWSITGRRHSMLVLAFVAGLVMDAVSTGPLGYWAVIYLAGVELAASLSDLARDSMIGHGVAVLATLTTVTALGLAIASAYERHLPDIAEAAEAAALAALCYPLLAGLLHSLLPRVTGPALSSARGRP